MSQKNLEGGWSGFGMATVGIHPNDFWVLNGHPNKIPTNEMLGDVVNNCPEYYLQLQIDTAQITLHTKTGGGTCKQLPPWPFSS